MPLSPDSTPNQVLGYIYSGITEWLRVNGTHHIEPHAPQQATTGLYMLPWNGQAPEYQFTIPGEVLARYSAATYKALQPESLECVYQEAHLAKTLGGSTPTLQNPKLIISDQRRDGCYRDWEIFPNHHPDLGTRWGYMTESAQGLTTQRSHVLDIPGLTSLTQFLESQDTSSLQNALHPKRLARIMRAFRRR